MAERDDVALLLRETGFFDGLGADQLAAVAQMCRESRYAQGEMIFARGDPGDQLIVVGEGRVRLSVMAEDGRELSVRHVVRGALLGEIAVLDGGVRTADAVALAAVTAYGLRRSSLDALLEAHPAMARGVIAQLCRRLRDTTEQLEGIALHSIEQRLARFLLVSLAGRTAPPGKRVALELNFSQGELAQLLGASRPKVNGALGALERSGALRRTADRLFCDPAMLAGLAGAADV